RIGRHDLAYGLHGATFLRIRPTTYHCEEPSNARCDLRRQRKPAKGLRSRREDIGGGAVELRFLQELAALVQVVRQAPKGLGGGRRVGIGEERLEAQRWRRQAVAMAPHP